MQLFHNIKPLFTNLHKESKALIKFQFSYILLANKIESVSVSIKENRCLKGQKPPAARLF